MMASRVDARHSKERSSSNAKKLKKYLLELSIAEAESAKRNEELLSDITQVKKSAHRLNMETDKLRSVRDEYADYFNRMYPTWKQNHVQDISSARDNMLETNLARNSLLETNLARNSLLDTGSVRKATFKMGDIVHSTPLHAQNNNLPPLSVPEKTKRRLHSLSAESSPNNENIPPSVPAHSTSMEDGKRSYAVELEDEELQIQYRDFIKKKMGRWRNFPSLPDDMNPTNHRTNNQLIELLQERINKCETHLRDLGGSVSNKKELDRNFDVGYRTSKRALQEIELECERLKSEYMNKYAMQCSPEAIPPQGVPQGSPGRPASAMIPPHDDYMSRDASSLPPRCRTTTPPPHSTRRQFNNRSSPKKDYLNSVLNSPVAPGRTQTSPSKTSPYLQSSPQLDGRRTPTSTTRHDTSSLNRDYLGVRPPSTPTHYNQNTPANQKSPGAILSADFMSSLQMNPSPLNYSINSSNNGCPNCSFNQSIDENGIRILPQLLGLSPEGQLVLVPMAEPLKGSLCSQDRSQPSSVAERLHGETRSSPIGQSSLPNDAVKSNIPNDAVKSNIRKNSKEVDVKPTRNLNENFDHGRPVVTSSTVGSPSAPDVVSPYYNKEYDSSLGVAPNNSLLTQSKVDGVQKSYSDTLLERNNKDNKLKRNQSNPSLSRSNAGVSLSSEYIPTQDTPQPSLRSHNYEGKHGETSDPLYVATDDLLQEKHVDLNDTKNSAILESLNSSVVNPEDGGGLVKQTSQMSADNLDVVIDNKVSLNKSVGAISVGDDVSCKNSQSSSIQINDNPGSNSRPPHTLSLNKYHIDIDQDEFDKSFEVEKSVSHEKSVELDNLIEECRSDGLDKTDTSVVELNDNVGTSSKHEKSAELDKSGELNKSDGLDKSNNSMFSGFSEDVSEFNLPSTGDVLDQPDVVQEEHENIDCIDGSRVDERVLNVLIDKLMEHVMDDQSGSEEVLVLSMKGDLNVLNAVLSAIGPRGAGLGGFSGSQVCMVYRHQLQRYMEENKKPFILGGLDTTNDFEGHLRDCIDPCYLNIWDSLFAFLSVAMQEFVFDASQVAAIFAGVLIPNHQHMRTELQTSLTNILKNISSSDIQTWKEEEEEEGSGPNNNMAVMDTTLPTNMEEKQRKMSISMTEEISTAGISADVVVASPQLSSPGHVDSKGDLSKTMSMERVLNDNVVQGDGVGDGGGLKGDGVMGKYVGDGGNDSSLELGSVSLDMSDDDGVNGDDVVVDGPTELAADEIIPSEEDIKKPHPLTTSKSFDLGSMSNDESESEDESDMSFNSDGLPVPKSPRKKPSTTEVNPPTREEGGSPWKNSEGEGERLDVTSPSYQKMRQESLASPLEEDDDDDLDDMLGESLGLTSKGSAQFRSKISSPSPGPITSPDMKSNEIVKTNDTSKKLDKDGGSDRGSKRSDVTSPALSSTALNDNEKGKDIIKLKKPGFWENSDEESDDDVDMEQISKAATMKSNADDDDDDFDFDFYD